MFQRFLSSILVALVVWTQGVVWQPVEARELSKAGQVFQQVRSSVVTIFTGVGHGSGFLVDDSGLIVTNSHVVRHGGQHLRVRFEKGQVLEAVVLENNREHDVAVVWVNLENIPDVQPVKLFGGLSPLTEIESQPVVDTDHEQSEEKANTEALTTAVVRQSVPTSTSPESVLVDEPEALVLVGEQVVAVGSPLHKEVLDRTMTLGIVSRYDGRVIIHDASVNGGNSGGPLFNYDGQVVGINSFVRSSENGPGLSGAVPIDLARPVIRAAQDKIAHVPPQGEVASGTEVTIQRLSPELLPDVPSIEFPISQFLKENPEVFPKRKQKDYNFDGRYFAVSVETPPQGYRQQMKLENKILKSRRKRAKKKGFEISDDELDYKNLTYYDYTKPVVQFMVVPKPKLTNGSRVVNTLTFIGAAGLTALSFGAGAPLMLMPFVMGKHEVKKDFLEMSLQKRDTGDIACEPIESGRVPFDMDISAYSELHYSSLIDKLYVGVYTFDATCFKGDESLALVVDVEGATDDDRVLKVPDKLREIIVEDFTPYWAYVAEQEGDTVKAAVDNTEAPAEEPTSDTSETVSGAAADSAESEKQLEESIKPVSSDETDAEMSEPVDELFVLPVQAVDMKSCTF